MYGLLGTTTTTLASLFSGDDAIDITTVLDEIVDLLPIVIPVMIGFIALRKGIAFIQSVLHSA